MDISDHEKRTVDSIFSFATQMSEFLPSRDQKNQVILNSALSLILSAIPNIYENDLRTRSDEPDVVRMMAKSSEDIAIGYVRLVFDALKTLGYQHLERLVVLIDRVKERTLKDEEA